MATKVGYSLGTSDESPARTPGQPASPADATPSPPAQPVMPAYPPAVPAQGAAGVNPASPMSPPRPGAHAQPVSYQVGYVPDARPQMPPYATPEGGVSAPRVAAAMPVITPQSPAPVSAANPQSGLMQPAFAAPLAPPPAGPPAAPVAPPVASAAPSREPLPNVGSTYIATPAAAIEVVLVDENTPPPRGQVWRVLEIWTRNRIYLLDAQLNCVEVVSRQTGKPESHQFLGAKLGGGQRREGDKLRLSHPLPVPGTEAVFKLPNNRRGPFGQTSKVERVVLRVRVAQVSLLQAEPAWAEITGEYKVLGD